jgi:MFS family permease
MFVGALLLLGCALVSLFGQSYTQFFSGLVLLGVGWNFLFVGGTTLLTEVYLPAEKGAVQGINDFMVFSATAFTALTSGYFHHVLGWEKLNLFTIPMVCFAAISILILGMNSRLRNIQAT